MRVTLTFDNGPDVVGTPAALAALAERGIAAVFFVVGQKVRAHPHLVAQARAAGHVIGNHTWSHTTPFGETRLPGFARTEIARTHEAIEAWVSAPPLFRPVGAAPGAVIDHRLLSVEALHVLEDGGYTVALWNVVPRDWERPHHWLDGAVDRCRELDHAVVVLHDGYPEAMALLPAFLDALHEAGAEFTTEFPLSCTPMRAGVSTQEASALATAVPIFQSAAPQRADLRSPSLKEQ